MMIPAYNKKGCAAFLSRRESITGERLTSFPKKIQPCLTRDSEPTRLQAEGHSYDTVIRHVSRRFRSRTGDHRSPTCEAS
ncbi:hypothetical protein TNCV_1652981 [Trichonephila clavipes]|nr:hypothetical protein TNCV_1652981 [Trichonephila clavipes]